MTGYTGNKRPRPDPLIEQIAKDVAAIETSMKELAQLIPRVDTLAEQVATMGVKVDRAHNLLVPFADELEELRASRRAMDRAIKVLGADVTLLQERTSSLPPSKPPSTPPDAA